MPNPRKYTPSHSREGGKVPVVGYESANTRPNMIKREMIKRTKRPASVYKNERGQDVIDLPPSMYNQVVTGVKDPEEAFTEAGVQEWELPSGEFLLGNTKHKNKILMEIPRVKEE